MGKIPCPYIEDGGEKTTRWTEKVGIGGGGRVSGAESGSNPARAAATASVRAAPGSGSAAVGSGSVFVHVLVEQQAHFLPVALHGALRDSAQLGDFGE
jgi:hypothetical protein